MQRLQCRGRGFDSRSGRCHVVTMVTVCGEVNRLGTNTKVNSAFHHYGIGKSSTRSIGIGLELRRGAFTCLAWQVYVICVIP